MDFVSAGRAKLAQRRGYARTNECHECNRPPKVGAILSQRPFPVMMSMQVGKGSTLFAHLKAGWVYCDGRYRGVNGLRDHCFLGLIRGLGGLPRRKVPKTRCAATTAAKVSVSVATLQNRPCGIAMTLKAPRLRFLRRQARVCHAYNGRWRAADHCRALESVA